MTPDDTRKAISPQRSNDPTAPCAKKNGHSTPVGEMAAELKCPLHHFDSLSAIVLATKLSGLTLQS